MGVDAVTLLGPRVETFWVDLLDDDDNFIRTLQTVESDSGTVTVNLDATIRGGCEVRLHEELDWLTSRIRPWVRVNDQSWPLGVYLTASPTLENDSTGQAWKVGGLDKTVILDEWKADESFVVDAGVQVIPKVIELINSVGESRITATDNGKISRYSHTWPPGTAMLRIVNDLLLSVDYSAVWVDGYGFFRLEPYILPRNRAISRTFRAGQASIHSPSWTREQDIASVPNKVVAVTTGTGPEPGMIATAVNTRDDSPYSYQNRGGRWVVKHYEGVEAVDQASLDALAERYLWGASSPSAHLKVSHAVVPVEIGQVVRFISTDIDVKASINEYKIPLQVGGLTEALWTELT